MLLVIALYSTFVCIGNLADYNSNYDFVRHVLDMDSIFENSRLTWRALTNPVFHTAVYWAVIGGEAAVAVLGWLGSYQLYRKRNASTTVFAESKTIGLYAFMLAILVWFVGFVDIGSEWFAMWQSTAWNGKQTAMDVTMVVVGFLIVYVVPEPALNDE